MAVHAEPVSQKMRSLMHVRIGNFPPNSRAVLTCYMYSELSYEHLTESYVYRLPLTYIPHYLIGNHHPNVSVDHAKEDVEMKVDGDGKIEQPKFNSTS